MHLLLTHLSEEPVCILAGFVVLLLQALLFSCMRITITLHHCRHRLYIISRSRLESNNHININIDTMFSDPSASMSSSSLSSSHSSRSSRSPRSYPIPAFANPIAISKSSISPPSTTSFFDISPSAPFYAPATPSASCAYPSWPSRSFLSPTASAASINSYCGRASLYISDEDLADDFSDLKFGNHLKAAPSACDFDEDQPSIPWEMTRQPPLVVQSLGMVGGSMPQPQRSQGRIVVKEKKKSRRRGPSLRRAKTTGGPMSPIAE